MDMVFTLTAESGYWQESLCVVLVRVRGVFWLSVTVSVIVFSVVRSQKNFCSTASTRSSISSGRTARL